MSANRNSQALEKYEHSLHSIPAPGAGCHPHLLRAANYGVFAGVERDVIVSDISASIPVGTRRVRTSEVEQAVERALLDFDSTDIRLSSHLRPDLRLSVKRIDSDVFFEEARRQVPLLYAVDDYEAELWEASTIRMDRAPEYDAALLIEHMYKPDDFLFIGEQYDTGVLGKTIRSAEQWVRYFKSGGSTAPHIIPNPLTGKPGTTKTGTTTMRGDSCVKSFRFAVVEFDGIPKTEQAIFWLFADMPVCAIIDSGGKSLHGWVRADARDADVWREEIENELFGQYLKPLGVDIACKNEGRMSRLPGHMRDGKDRQKLLYFAPESKAVWA